MGERYQDVEKPSVCLHSVVPSNLFLMHNMIAMRICPKSLVILMERRRRPSFCLRVVRAMESLLHVDWFIDGEPVQSRDLASAMRSALTTRGLADCASLILKTVSVRVRPVCALKG
jgi:hypothetical protein